MPLDVKKAVELARASLADILLVPVSKLLLEEVELTDDHQFWLITFSYPSPPDSAIQTMLGSIRAYKVVKLHAETGEFISIKIRSLAAA
jgi:hypothetical protein